MRLSDIIMNKLKLFLRFFFHFISFLKIYVNFLSSNYSSNLLKNETFLFYLKRNNYRKNSYLYDI